MESAAGLGLLTGPFIGALLYEIGGYVTPFAFLGICYLVLWPIIVAQLKDMNLAENDSHQTLV